MIGAGSQTSSQAGLSHYTVRADNVKDSGTVAIGYHYVATASGQPTDSDGDGIPDYIEDRNGNGGAPDAGETDWNVYNSPNGLAAIPDLQVFTLLK